MSIGTIVGDTAIKIKWLKGGTLGTVEEYFIARLKPGDTFMFAGRLLEFVRFRDMIAYVRRSKKKKGQVPQWMGGRMNLSSRLSEVLRQKIDAFSVGDIQDPEMETLVPIMDLQQRLSSIPAANELLVEYLESTKGSYHLVFFPFEGRNIHEILASLIAYRIGKLIPISFSLAFNDYGFELSSDQPIPVEKALDSKLFSTKNLMDDILKSINSAEMARRKFRDIAVIAGLVFKGFPGNIKRTKHLQASSSLLFEVFSEYESDNLLMRQAFNEVFYDQFDEVRLRQVMDRINAHRIIYHHTEKPSPFAFPIIVEMLRERMSSESLEDRVRRMIKQMEES
jgi:ATP-dependent Lhr-like helicase